MAWENHADLFAAEAEREPFGEGKQMGWRLVGVGLVERVVGCSLAAEHAQEERALAVAVFRQQAGGQLGAMDGNARQPQRVVSAEIIDVITSVDGHDGPLAPLGVRPVEELLRGVGGPGGAGEHEGAVGHLDEQGVARDRNRVGDDVRAVADVTCDQAWREFGRLVRTWHWGVARRRRDMDGQREA